MTKEITKGKWGISGEGELELLIMSGNTCVAKIVKTHFPESQEANAHLIAQSPRMAEWIAKVARQGFVVFPEDKKEAKEIIETLNLS